MKLREDGTVESLTVKRSSGSKALAEHAMRTLKAYRFRPKTKSPLLWLVSFDPAATVIVKAMVVKDEQKLHILPL
jgi:TonB family protein